MPGWTCSAGRENGQSSGIGFLEDVKGVHRVFKITVVVILRPLLSGTNVFLEDQGKSCSVPSGHSSPSVCLMVAAVAAACFESTRLAVKPTLPALILAKSHEM